MVILCLVLLQELVDSSAFFILLEVEGSFSKFMFLFLHPTVLTLSCAWRTIGRDVAVVRTDLMAFKSIYSLVGKLT